MYCEYRGVYFQFCIRLFFVVVLFLLVGKRDGVGMEWGFLCAKIGGSLGGLSPIVLWLWVLLDGLARFEVCLRVVADGAFFGRGFIGIDMSTI